MSGAAKAPAPDFIGPLKASLAQMWHAHTSMVLALLLMVAVAFVMSALSKRAQRYRR